jgi:hypothetical protein
MWIVALFKLSAASDSIILFHPELSFAAILLYTTIASETNLVWVNIQSNLALENSTIIMKHTKKMLNMIWISNRLKYANKFKK